MPTVNISLTITSNELEALKLVAKLNGMTPLEYGESVLMSAVKSSLRGYYKKKFNKLSLIEAAQLFGDV